VILGSKRIFSVRRLACRAFSLIELLVVVGLIAVLVGILLPVLGRAREAANTAACLSNMNMIGIAIRNYSADYSNYPPPVTVNDTIFWYNILVDKKYLNSPDGTNRGPQTRSVFYCPGSNTTDFLSAALSGVTNIPASRTDMRGAMAVRWQSPDTGTSIDCWYGMNADQSDDPTLGFPCRKAGDGMVMIKMNQITRPSDLVMLYDGVFWHLGGMNANRLNARHVHMTRTNLAFFDGHAQTYPTTDLPGGIGVAQISDFSLASLQANRKNGSPLWLLDQQR
jgi:prepilin-type N-terminal cleavage/methylation domain-containing protein/prepilin-type processing-associated H-X9-DG protein